MSVLQLFEFVLVLGLCGVALYLIDKYIPMERHIKILLNVVAIIVLCIWSFFWIVDGFGLWGLLNVDVSRVHHYRR